MDIVNRLKEFMDNEEISISQFADTCKIPRPTLSQLLNGRNKKVSDEFIGKIHAAFPDLSIVWLLFGEGSMTANASNQFSEPQNTPFGSQNQSQPSDFQDNHSTNPFNESFAENIAENSTLDFSAYRDGSQPRNGTPDSHHQTGNSPVIQDSTYQNPIASSDERNNNGSHNLPHSLFDTDTDEPDYPSYSSPRYRESSPISNVAPDDSFQKKAPNYKTPDIVFSEKSPYPENSTPLAEEKPSVISQSNKSDIDNPQTHSIRINTTPDKRISNIVVFYSDNSFQSFYPEQTTN